MNAELEQLGEQIAEQAAYYDAAMHRLLANLREFDRRGGWHLQGAKSCAHWLAWRVGWDLGTARQRVRVACKLAEFPLIDDSFISREAARRLACDAGVIEVVEDEHGTPLSVGRKRRTITGPLRRALYKRDGACTFPGCTNRLFLEGHHNTHWADGGETSIENISLVCGFHHRYVHEYGYRVEIGPDQRPRFCDPSGRQVEAAPPRPETAGLGRSKIWAANAALKITANTPACGWDGSRADYGTMVGHLVRIDGLT